MGIIECDKHGKQLIRGICSHLEEKVSLSEKPDGKIRVIKDITFDTEGCFLYYCEACFEKLPFPKSGIISPDNDNYFELRESAPGICSGCWKGYLQFFKIQVVPSFYEN